LRVAPLRYINRTGYHAVVFRRTLPKVKASGGLVDKSLELYPKLGGHLNRSELKWHFPSGSTVKFWHLSSPDSWSDWSGSEVSFFAFDELTEFTQTQFLKILGCSRSTCGVKPQIFATCNPAANHWLRDFVDWWLASDGYVDPEKNGKLRYFTVIQDDEDRPQFHWVDRDWRDSNGQPPKSATFIVSDIWDNPALLESNPEYLSSLMAQNAVDRARYLGERGRGGNWTIVESSGLLFKSAWFEIVDRIPDFRPDPKKCVRFWDLAATIKDYSDPSASVKMITVDDDEGKQMFYILDMTNEVMTPDRLEQRITGCANGDGRGFAVRWEQERGGSAAIRDSAARIRNLNGFNSAGLLAWGDKIERSKGLSAAAEQGRVKLLRASWNSAFLNQLQGFPDQTDHDDIVDAASYAYNYLANYTPIAMGKFKH
jgi:predicted phage terminase large subunit-like protein